MTEIPLGGITQQGTGVVEGNIDRVEIIRVTDYHVAHLDQAIIKPPEEIRLHSLGSVAGYSLVVRSGRWSVVLKLI